MTALNVLRGWDRNLDALIAARRYDIEIRFSDPQPSSLATRVQNVRGVRVAEVMGSSPTSVVRDGEIALDHAYPDHAHGSTYIAGIPPHTKLIELPLREGRWLVAGDTDAVVLTPAGTRILPNARIGDVVTLPVFGAPIRWRVVGIAEEFGPAPAAYVTEQEFARAAGEGDFAQLLRIATDATSENERNVILESIEGELERAGASIEMVISMPALRSIMDDHMGILTGALTVIALLMAAVSGIALSSTISIGVLQRTREFGVMKAIGATSGMVRRLVVAEGLLAGILGWMCAVILAVPLTVVFGSALGTAAFGSSISVLVTPKTALLWLAITTIISATASLIPAHRASKLTIREALSQT